MDNFFIVLIASFCVAYLTELVGLTIPVKHRILTKHLLTFLLSTGISFLIWSSIIYWAVFIGAVSFLSTTWRIILDLLTSKPKVIKDYTRR